MRPLDRICPLKRRRRASLSPGPVRRDGALCVTFINTASAKRRALETYDDLLVWGLEHDALDDADVALLMRAAVERPDAAADVVRRAQALRAAAEHLLLDLAAGRTEEGEHLDALNAELSAQHSSRTLVRHGIGVRWGWIEPGAEGRMLWPVVVSTGNLLTSDHGLRLIRCAGEDCDLLFLDSGPGRVRRWCNRWTCGDRAEALEGHEARLERKREWLQRHLSRQDCPGRQSPVY